MYKLTISVMKGNLLITCIYTSECDNMQHALEKAGKYALFQCAEENADYVYKVEVVRYEEAA